MVTRRRLRRRRRLGHVLCHVCHERQSGGGERFSRSRLGPAALEVPRVFSALFSFPRLPRDNYPLKFLFIPRAEITSSTFNLLNLVSGGLKKLRVEAFILVGEMNKTFIRKSQPIKNRESVLKLPANNILQSSRQVRSQHCAPSHTYSSFLVLSTFRHDLQDFSSDCDISWDVQSCTGHDVVPDGWSH